MTNTIKYFHGGTEIDKINDDSVFGGFLFFSQDYETADAHTSDTLYEIETGFEIVDASHMFYIDDSDEICAEIIKEVIDMIDFMQCDEETAMNLLDESTDIITLYEENVEPSTESIDHLGEMSWIIQRKTAECAKLLGYRGVNITDEHGQSTMIYMIGHESELTIIK